MNLARGSGQSRTDLDVLIAVHACRTLSGECHRAEASDIYEALLACPALGIKYVPVSCRTNYQIHVCERVLLRALKLLPTENARRAAKETAHGQRRLSRAAAFSTASSQLRAASSGVTAFLTNPAE